MLHPKQLSNRGLLVAWAGAWPPHKSSPFRIQVFCRRLARWKIPAAGSCKLGLTQAGHRRLLTCQGVEIWPQRGAVNGILIMSFIKRKAKGHVAPDCRPKDEGGLRNICNLQAIMEMSVGALEDCMQVRLSDEDWLACARSLYTHVKQRYPRIRRVGHYTDRKIRTRTSLHRDELDKTGVHNYGSRFRYLTQAAIDIFL